MHEDSKNSNISKPAYDHDLWYLMEAVSKLALANREEISGIKLQIVKLPSATSYEKLVTTISETLKNCCDHIHQQEVKFDDFKVQMQRDLEQLKSKTPEAGLREREHLACSPSSLTLATSAPCLGGPSCKISDPTSVDPNIVKECSDRVGKQETKVADFTHHSNSHSHPLSENK